jgi:hypothetical protein
MSSLVDWIANLAQPWVDFYSGSAITETVVMFLHLGGMVAAGGIAFTLDRAVIRAGRNGWPRRPDLARELHQSHRAVIGGLALVMLSGLALTASDPSVYLESWIYWAKMVAVVLLLVNGLSLKRSGERLLAEPDDEGAFHKLRAAALRSATLWAAAVLGGVAITMYA